MSPTKTTTKAPAKKGKQAARQPPEFSYAVSYAEPDSSNWEPAAALVRLDAATGRYDYEMWNIEIGSGDGEARGKTAVEIALEMVGQMADSSAAAGEQVAWELLAAPLSAEEYEDWDVELTDPIQLAEMDACVRETVGSLTDEEAEEDFDSEIEEEAEAAAEDEEATG